MALRCPNGHEVTDGGFQFCPFCGERIEASLTDVTPSEQEMRPPEPLPGADRVGSTARTVNPIPTDRPSAHMKTRWKLLGGLVILIVGAGAIGSIIGGNDSTDATSVTLDTTAANSTIAPAPPKPKGYGFYLNAGLTIRTAAAKGCGAFRTAIAAGQEQGTSIDDGLTKIEDDPYASADYIATHAVSTGHADAFKRKMLRLANSKLRRVVHTAPTPTMVQRYMDDSLFVCHEKPAYNRALVALNTADGDANVVQGSAQNVPWYPKGYNEQDDNVAWKWVDTRSCHDFAENGCWHVAVITKDGCSSYVAVNANEYRGGAIINQLLDNQGFGIPGGTVRIFELDADAGNVTADDVQIDCN